jgi:hypothetical protein
LGCSTLTEDFLYERWPIDASDKSTIFRHAKVKVLQAKQKHGSNGLVRTSPQANDSLSQLLKDPTGTLVAIANSGRQDGILQQDAEFQTFDEPVVAQDSEAPGQNPSKTDN